MKKSAVVLLHLGYWMMYLLLLLSFFALLAPLTPNFEKHNFFEMALFWWGRLLFGFAIVPGIIAFYFFYTVLFNKFLAKKKILYVFLSGIAVSIICSVIGQLIMFPMVPETNWCFETIVSLGIIMSFNSIANGIIGLVMKGFITSYGDIKLKEDLNKKNYEMELALVKSQINPHFLFNTINNIDVLIEKDAVKASEYLNKLSDIMRFMLYETKTEKIALSKELTYIEKYIDLQKIRTSNPNYVNYSVKGDANNLMIAPMLFIPFIENAFKHAENKKIENAINILVAIEKDKITFDCENNYTEDNQSDLAHSGLGNELIRKRLELLYPTKHTLEISDTNKTYNVKLILFL